MLVAVTVRASMLFASKHQVYQLKSPLWHQSNRAAATVTPHREGKHSWCSRSWHERGKLHQTRPVCCIPMRSPIFEPAVGCGCVCVLLHVCAGRHWCCLNDARQAPAAPASLGKRSRCACINLVCSSRFILCMQKRNIAVTDVVHCYNCFALPPWLCESGKIPLS